MSWVHTTVVSTTTPPSMARRRGPIGLVPSAYPPAHDDSARPIGRAAELQALARLSSASWLTTVTGLAGIGKSALVEGWLRSLGEGAMEKAPASEQIADLDLARVRAAGDRSVLTTDSVAPHQLAEVRSALIPGETVVTTARMPFGVDGEAVLTLGPLARRGDDGGETVAIVIDAWGAARATLPADEVEAARWLARLSDGWPGVAVALGRRARVLGLRELAGALSSADEFSAWCRLDPDVDALVQATIAGFDGPASACAAALSGDGAHTIDELAQCCGLGRAETAFELVKLLQAGAVVVSPGTPRRYRLLTPLAGAVRAIDQQAPANWQGESAARPLAWGGAPAMVREGDTWAIDFDGHATRVRHLKGLGDIARLLSEPHRPIAAIDLADGAVIDRHAPPALDRRAVDELRTRARQLRGALDGGHVPATHATGRRHELELIEHELRRSIGPGGRVRPLGATAQERARKTVSFRVRHAIRRVGERHPRLAAHLDRTITTGATCRYDPAPHIEWTVRP